VSARRFLVGDFSEKYDDSVHLECRPIEWLKLASVNKIKHLAHDRMVSFSGRISALTQGCVHRVHRTQTQQQSQLYARQIVRLDMVPILGRII
jgi:hypothetical protein